MNREKLYEVCKLTSEQQKAFDKLKRAYKDCEKKGILFTNVYGWLAAFNSELVAGYGDYDIKPDGVLEVELNGYCPAEQFRIVNEWADDSHILGLTEKGKELYLSEDED